MIGQGPPDFQLRTSLRQAVIVDAASLRSDDSRNQAPSPFADALRQSIYLDLLGSLVGVNGVTISVLSTGLTQSSQLTAITPPGIDLMTPPDDSAEPSSRLAWAVDHHLHRAFTRIVVIVADVPALPTRTVATTLSSLASADVIVGTSTETGVYLLAVRDLRGLRAVEAAGAASGLDRLVVSSIAAPVGEDRITLRYVERRDRLVIDRLDPVREAVLATPNAAPRTATLLRIHNDEARAQTNLSVFGGFEADFGRGLDR